MYQESNIEPDQRLSSRRSTKIEMSNDEYAGERVVINLRNVPSASRNKNAVKTEKDLNTRNKTPGLIDTEKLVEKLSAQILSERGKSNKQKDYEKVTISLKPQSKVSKIRTRKVQKM